MTKERMQYLLDTVSGAGVVCTLPNGNEVYYFYQDFNERGEGIERAMKQIYPQLNSGKFKKVEFIGNWAGFPLFSFLVWSWNIIPYYF